MVSKQDETFLAIAQAGSVSKAAQGLYLSQPAVSRSLKRLEEDLGVQLFDREAAPSGSPRRGSAICAMCGRTRSGSAASARTWPSWSGSPAAPCGWA